MKPTKKAKTVKAWAVVEGNAISTWMGKLLIHENRDHADMMASKYERVVRCEIRLIEGRK